MERIKGKITATELKIKSKDTVLVLYQENKPAPSLQLESLDRCYCLSDKTPPLRYGRKVSNSLLYMGNFSK